MKTIISHDIDHITAWEHKKDLIIPKFIVRSSLELVLGKICFKEYMDRYKELFKNKLQNIEELMEFDRRNKVPSTFFIAVAKGLGLSYSLKDAEFWIRRILHEGFDIGTHGIAINNYYDMVNEYNIFKRLSCTEIFGVRMHYLKRAKNMHMFLNKVGYLFDTTLFGLESPYKIDSLWEFPLHIMDGYVVYKRKRSRWQNYTLRQLKETSKKEIEEAYNVGIRYFNILFHDRYFSNSFKTQKDWYIWFIRYIKENQIEIISYKDSIEELVSNNKKLY